ncbi:hemerythrin domain-containing protein [Sphingomonas sp. CJ20]
MKTDARAELLRDHAAIEMLSVRLSTLIAQEAEPEVLALALDHLVQTVASHLEVEDETIYCLTMEKELGAPPAEVSRAHDEFQCLKANWGAYLTAWKAEEIAADRAGFIRETKAMLPRLRDRVRLETHLLSLVSRFPVSGGVPA